MSKKTNSDIDLKYDPIENSPLYESVNQMLQSAIELEFGYNDILLPDTTKYGAMLNIPISITSITAHSIPSGTSFSREAWLEVIIMDKNLTIVYQSGLIQETESLSLEDSTLILFTSYLLDEQNDTTDSITETYGIIDNLLQGFNTVPAYYNFLISESLVDFLDIQVRMLFRAFKPHLLRIEHPELLEHLPVFEMASIRDTVYIQSSQ